MAAEIIANIFLSLLILVVVVIAGLYLFFKLRYRYWAKRGVPFAKPIFPFGNLKVSPKYSIHESFKNLYNEGKHEKVFGFWQMHKPVLFINDPDLIKYVLVEKFTYFEDRGVYKDEKHPSTGGLFFMDGLKWKNQRAKVVPIFTSGRMKKTFPKITEIANEMKKIVGKLIEKGEYADGKEIIARYVIDVMSCTFGLDANTLQNSDSVIRKMWKRVFMGWRAMTRMAIYFLFPEIAKMCSLSPFETSGSDFFLETFLNIIYFRNVSGVSKDDALQHLIKLLNEDEEDINSVTESNNTEKSEKDTFTPKRAAAMALGFFFGNESTSTAMQFALYELALNSEIQKRVQEEITTVLENYNDELTYEAIGQMTYLDCIIQETLRKYSPSPLLFRVCTKDCFLPDLNVLVDEGTTVYINVKGIHKDERYYPDPEKFDPDRFTEEQKALRPRCTYLPFGDGPRICIGNRFAMMEMKAGLASLLSSYKFELSSQIASKPIVYDFKSLSLSPRDGLYFKISPLRVEK